jgi:histidine triad (HIT) family protein
MKNCIFCKIAKGEVPCDKIYEDKSFMVFLDIQPVSHGHILIIPKKHFVWMQDVDDETISEIFKLTKKVMLAIKKGLGCDFVQVSVVGNEVPHFHIHLIPRFINDHLHQYSFPRGKYKDRESSELIEKITRVL